MPIDTDAGAGLVEAGDQHLVALGQVAGYENALRRAGGNLHLARLEAPVDDGVDGVAVKQRGLR